MANSKFDNQLERMNFLMGYKNSPVNESKKSNKIECHMLGADNKVYGILKEGTMYYIMSTEKGKENLAESYEYLGGYNYRNENAYKSYNEATKQLELHLMSLNESRGKKLNTSTVDLNRSQKTMTTLTEEARKELDRMHQIFENSQTIGKNNVGDPESKGKATDPAKQGDPYEEPAKAELDKDLKETGTVDGATPDNTDVKGVEADLESDKMKTANSGSEGDFKAAHDDLEGDGVADKDPKGAKAVKMNEGLEIDDTIVDETEPELAPDVTPDDETALVGLENDEVPEFSAELDDEEEYSDADELEALLREFMEDDEDETEVVDEACKEACNEAEECTCEKGCKEALDGPHGDGNNNVKGEETMDRVDEEEASVEGAGEKEDKIVGPDEVMDGPHGTLDADTMDRLAESICNKFFNKKATSKKDMIQEMVDRIVAEEVTRLDAWGKHPRYQKPAFQTPANKEVSPNGAEDWNDDSAKGEQPYGKKIGDGAPFEKLVDLITDNIKKQIKEGKLSKKA